MGEEIQCDQRDAFEALDLGGLDSKLSLNSLYDFIHIKVSLWGSGLLIPMKEETKEESLRPSIVTLCCLSTPFFSVSLWPQLHLGRESAIIQS